ncbi:MAG TPA: A-macroglobulin complement component [Planctomycetes bacterium]|nr:A-macroglobulin complement component [Planctomycetota bacterium]
MSRMRLLMLSLSSLAMIVAGASIWQAYASEDVEDNSGKHSLTSSQSLGGLDRYLTHISTDKPLYRPGEQLRVRGVVLHGDSHKPMPASLHVAGLVTIKGPKGDTVAAGYANGHDSVMAFAWNIPVEQAGGQYTIHMQTMNGYAPAERTFEIRAYRAPRLKSQIKFIRDGYGPSDQVAATLHVERAEGGVPKNATVTVTARVDGDEVFRGQSSVDDQGNCSTRFQLPEIIRRGEGVLSMAIKDGGVVETATKTIPILLQTVDLSMYPEGGELVAGLKTRIYFEAFTPAGKPADLAGVVIDKLGVEIAKFRSEHEGRGRFELKPKSGEQYRLRITEPAGIKTEFPLPKVSSTGATISTRRDIYLPNRQIDLRVSSTHPVVTVTISKREKLIYRTSVKRQGRVRFKPPAEIDGVLVATVWDQAGKPLAERLLFRQPKRMVRVQLSADADRYSPGGRAKVSVLTTDERGNPISAIVSVTVTDDSVLEMIDKREQAPNLRTMVLLESEVRELADAHIYLDASNAGSPRALDLLLGTQGWRRFAFVHPAEFSKRHNQAARRVLASVQQMVLGRGSAGWAFKKDFQVDRSRIAIPQLGAKFQRDGDDEFRPDDKAQELKPREQLAAAEREDGKPAEGEARQKLDALNGLDLAKDADGKRRLAQFGLGGGGGFGGRAALVMSSDFVAVRLYAHQVREDRKPNDRIDFAETLYWHAGVKTDENGRGAIEFHLNDAVTSFRVSADAFSGNGGLGGQSLQIESVKPFYLEPKLPLEVTQGDRILAPLGIVNATGEQLADGSIEVSGHGFQPNPDLEKFTLNGDERRRALLEMLAGESGVHAIVLDGQAGQRTDRITRRLVVQPRGFPVESAKGGLLAGNSKVEYEIVIPSDVVPNSISGRVVIYPTPLASMTEALQRLIREPSGCFEQTSSTTYPLVMAQQYFMSHQGVDPALIERTAGILEKGYNRLLGFESKGGGFEWFGRAPGHDALTAYGILEFTDMSQVRFVDEAMLQRSRAWLLKQRDGKGGFIRQASTLHTWLADPEISNSYNLWALLESGEQADLSTEVLWVRDAGEKTQNTYVMALAANVLGLAGDREGQNHLLDELAGMQDSDGSLKGATRSVVGSGGAALNIETTALAVMAWLKNPSYVDNVEQSIKYLAENCKAGRFGSTQSTVLALRAIVAYDQSRAMPKAPGTLRLLVDGRQIGAAVVFTAKEQGAIELPEISGPLSPGKHVVTVVMEDGSKMPYSMAFDFYREKPDSSADCQLHLEVELRDTKLTEGTATEANVTVINRSDSEVASPVAIIGVPGGLEVRHDQLKELVKADTIAAYEVIGREIILYWRVLDAEQRVELPLSLIAEIPGDYTGPASRAYLYYTDEFKQWSDPLRVNIQPSDLVEDGQLVPTASKIR